MYEVLIISNDSNLLSQAKRFVTNINDNIKVETLDDLSRIREVLSSTKHIDVVVCDHNPPVVDAISIFNMLTCMDHMQPFIIMTKAADGEVAIKAFELRMDYYLSRENVMNFYMDLASKIVLCSERRRLEVDRALNERRMKALLNLVMMREKESEDILNYALEESVTLTNSTIGYIAMYEEGKNKLKMAAWSKGGLDQCSMENRQITYDFDDTGLWGEPIRQGKPIIVNDYDSDKIHPKNGVPHGHVPLNRIMMIPIYHNGKIFATAGVGNKILEYTSDDLVQFTLLMDGLISIYHERMLEGENIKSERNLKGILQNAPVGIIIVDNDTSVIVDNDYARSMLSTHSLCMSKELLKSNSNELSRLISRDIEKVRETGQRLEAEHSIDQKGKNLVFKVNVDKTKGKNNEDSGFIIIIDDISELASVSRHNLTALERINLLDTLINDDIRRFLAKIEKEAENMPDAPSLSDMKNDIRSLNEIMTFVKEYHDVGILDPQWQSLEEVLCHVMDISRFTKDDISYNVKGIKILADPALYNVFSQLISYSKSSKDIPVKCSIKCRLEDRELIICYSDNGKGIPDEKKDDFVSGAIMDYGRGIYLAFNILKACGFVVRESGIYGEGMFLEIVVPTSKYSISWD